MYQGEVHRCLDWVELREELHLEYDITEEQYRSDHSVTGKIRGKVTPDQEVVRARQYPPQGLVETVVQSISDDTGTVGEGYPGTDLYVGLTRVPPRTQSDEQFQRGRYRQDFTIDGIPKNGTIRLDEDWELQKARDSLANDETKPVVHSYEIDDLPSGQLPIVIRAELKRDAREHLESLPEDDQDRMGLVVPKKYEGQAALTVAIEYREDSPEWEVAGGRGILTIENLRAEMESTFPNIRFWPRENSTYNPDEKQVEWRKRKVEPGNTLQYDIFGRIEDLLGLDHISMTIRGTILGDTLTGTTISGLYDRTGRELTANTKPRGRVGGLQNVSMPQNDIAALREVMEKHPVRLAVLFDAETGDNQHQKSDISILVEFDDSVATGNKDDVAQSIVADALSTLNRDDIGFSLVEELEPGMGLEAFTDGIRLVGSAEMMESRRTRFRQAVEGTVDKAPVRIDTSHGVTLTGDIELDPNALRSQVRKVMEATISLNDTPFDAFDRLHTVCDREGMTIRSSEEPAHAEPVPGQEGVFMITKGEKDDRDDKPGELKVKRAYGDEGVVYADMFVYGRYTPIKRDREVSQFAGETDLTEDSLVRTDEGGLERRGKSTIDIRARSTDAQLNSQLIRTVQEGLRGDQI